MGDKEEDVELKDMVEGVAPSSIVRFLEEEVDGGGRVSEGLALPKCLSSKGSRVKKDVSSGVLRGGSSRSFRLFPLVRVATLVKPSCLSICIGSVGTSDCLVSGAVADDDADILRSEKRLKDNA